MFWSSCRKDFDFAPSTGNLEFSKDTIYLDTIFSNIGSSTYNLKVYNRSNDDISIPTVRLSQGESSNYRLNVDGLPGKEFENVELLANDSLFIFVETTADIQTLALNSLEFLYTDAIEFDTGNNLQKVVKTLQSRLITAVLNNLENKFLLKILQNICCKENINISNDIKDFLVENSNNSIVTIINNLEKIKLLTNNNDDDFTIESISEICNNISFETMKTYLELCKKKDLQNSINLLYDIYDKGYSVIDILNVLFIYVKNGNLLNENEKYNTITLISKYITIFYNLHEHEIELAIFTNNMVEILDS